MKHVIKTNNKIQKIMSSQWICLLRWRCKCEMLTFFNNNFLCVFFRFFSVFVLVVFFFILFYFMLKWIYSGLSSDAFCYVLRKIANYVINGQSTNKTMERKKKKKQNCLCHRQLVHCWRWIAGGRQLSYFFFFFSFMLFFFFLI